MDDVIIIGGSFAGISAALPIARARRTVRIIDTGLPRNRFSAGAHNVFGHDGRPPLDLREDAAQQLLAYPTATRTTGAVTDVKRLPDGTFSLTLEDGTRLSARRLILAYGVRDQLPDLPGFAEAWGKRVLHCPYCHGYEIAGKRWGAMIDPEWAEHVIPLYREWTDDLTLFLNGKPLPETAAATIAKFAVKTVAARVIGIDGTSPDTLTILTESGPVAIDALFAPQKVEPGTDIAQSLGCTMADGHLGPHVAVDARFQTNIPGVYAAGDLASPMHSISNAIGSGNMAGAMVHQSLLQTAT